MIHKSSLQLIISMMFVMFLILACGLLQSTSTPVSPPKVLQTDVPPTDVPPTDVPSTDLPPTDVMPTSTTGIIAGVVRGDDMKPFTEEYMIAALFCPSNDLDIECIDDRFWTIELDDLLSSICEADDTSSNCLLHIGEGASLIGTDGSYSIANVPPGEYAVVLIFPKFTIRMAKYDLSVQAGEITKHDFILDFHKK
jgi:hypothetical protein